MMDINIPGCVYKRMNMRTGDDDECKQAKESKNHQHDRMRRQNMNIKLRKFWDERFL